MTKSLTNLLSRVEALSGPDRHVDEDVRTALRIEDAHWYGDETPKYTASLDAALALAEKLAPDLSEIVYRGYLLWVEKVDSHKAKAADFPRYLLCALLRAKISDGGTS